MNEKLMTVGFSGEDEFCQSNLIAGVEQIAALSKYIMSPLRHEETTEDTENTGLSI